jgi:xanthosine utilization system XapX-like protein
MFSFAAFKPEANMTNESASNHMMNLWQTQRTESPGIRPGELRGKINKFERRIYWRNVREYVAGAVVITIFGYYEWRFRTLLIRLGSGMIIAGTLYVMYQLHRRASTRPAPADLGLSTCIDFHRKSLERQRDALRTVWSWYLLPLVPGLVVLMVGSILSQRVAHPENVAQLVIRILASQGIIPVVFFAIWKLNRRAAEKLQTQIDELNALRQDPD